MSGAEAKSSARARAARWGTELRAARIAMGWSQQDLASAVGVRKEAVADWENGRSLAAWENFVVSGRELGMRLVIVGSDGSASDGPVAAVPGDSWVRGELRRLAVVLRAERTAVGLSRRALAERIGVSEWSLSHFERAQLYPRLSVLSAWLDALACDIRWRRVV